MRKIFFIGGGFYGEIEKYVLENSYGVIQNAADTFQKNLLGGMRQQSNEEVVVLNFPFVGSYPKRFKKIWFKSFISDSVLSYGFFNLTGFKLFSRFISVIKSIFDVKPSNESCIIIYSVHLPFLAAVALYKKVFQSNIKVILIIPDLPEYMSSSNGYLIRKLKFIQSKILKSCYKSVNGYVLLSKHMRERIPANIEQYVVVEGVSSLSAADEKNHNHIDKVDLYRRTIFYSGTLDSRYGITELIDAVERLSMDVELLVCGEGDSKEYILDASKRTSRIKYLGQLPRKEVLQIQKNCTLLINPRSDVGQFTKYSFPSKIIEYMASGRPVLMYALPGIPSEYYEYCFRISDGGVGGIIEALENVLSMNDAALNDMGTRAKNFVLNEKSGLKQSQKIFNLMERLK